MGRTAHLVHTSAHPPRRPPLSAYVRYFFHTLPHPDLSYYRWGLMCLLLGYALCACVFVPRVMVSEPTMAWWALRWGTAFVLATLTIAVALRFIDAGTVQRKEEEEGDAHLTAPRHDPPALTHRAIPSHSTFSSSSSSSSASASGEPSPCPHCHTVHAARTEYCRRCMTCVQRYDHHCVLIDSCIGAGNLRFFLLALGLIAATAAIATRLCYHLLLSYTSVLPFYHPRCALALATLLLFAYLSAMASLYLAFHLVGLLYAERTMKEAFNRRGERKRPVWACGSGKWSRLARELAAVLGAPVRLRELRDKDRRSHDEREEEEEEEGWKGGDNPQDLTGCLAYAEEPH